MSGSILGKLQEQIKAVCLASSRQVDDIRLIAVSKGRSIDAIRDLYNQGVRDFGESKVQEAESKQKELPQDIRWHLIGSLQTKKVPKIIGKYHLIHSVDRLELARKISGCSLEKGIVTSILLQVNCSGELSKHGFSESNLIKLYPELAALKGVSIQGLMTMAPELAHSSPQIVSETFVRLTKLRDILGLQHLSMGMSQDYDLAIEAGATYLRIGSLLFPQ